MPMRLNIPTEVIWDPILDKYRENNWNCWQLATRSHILKLQFNAPNSIWAPLQTPLGEHTALPRPPTLILGVLLQREARGWEEAKKGMEGNGGRLLPPLPIRYATGSGEPLAASGTLGDLTWLEDFLTSKWLGSFTAVVTPLLKNRTLRN